jgi:hypothetical protein
MPACSRTATRSRGRRRSWSANASVPAWSRSRHGASSQAAARPAARPARRRVLRWWLGDVEAERVGLVLLGDAFEGSSEGPVHVGLLPAAAEGRHGPCGRNPQWGTRPALPATLEGVLAKARPGLALAGHGERSGRAAPAGRLRPAPWVLEGDLDWLGQVLAESQACDVEIEGFRQGLSRGRSFGRRTHRSGDLVRVTVALKTFVSVYGFRWQTRLAARGALRRSDDRSRH